MYIVKKGYKLRGSSEQMQNSLVEGSTNPIIQQ